MFFLVGKWKNRRETNPKIFGNSRSSDLDSTKWAPESQLISGVFQPSYCTHFFPVIYSGFHVTPVIFPTVTGPTLHGNSRSLSSPKVVFKSFSSTRRRRSKGPTVFRPRRQKRGSSRNVNLPRFLKKSIKRCEKLRD